MSREAHIQSILQWLITQGHLSLSEARAMAGRLSLDGDRLTPPAESETAHSMDVECALDDDCTAALEAEIERSGVFERARKLALAQRLRHAREKSLAPPLYARLMDLPEAQRAERLGREEAFHTRALVDLMLSEAKEACYQNIHRADTISSLAKELLSHLDPDRYGNETLADLGARLWAYRGNVHRLHYRWQEAEAAFQRAEEQLERGSGDLLLRALVYDLKASYLVARRDLYASFELLEEVATIYADLGETHLAGRAMVNQANTLKEMSRVDEAINLLRRALPQIDAQQEPRLELMTRHNLMFFLCEVGQAEESARLLRACKSQYLQYPIPAVQVRLRWLEGKIALGTDDLAEAEAALAATQKGLEEQGASYESALAALDLATVYAMQRRTADLKRLATELFTTFQSHDIHREAYAAIILFRQAAELEQVNIKVVKKVAALVERSQHLPPDQPS